jgi:hypothetical protein
MFVVNFLKNLQSLRRW